MTKRKHFTVYWDEEEEGEMMQDLERIARYEKRSKSSTVLVAVRQYVKRYLQTSDELSEN